MKRRTNTMKRIALFAVVFCLVLCAGCSSRDKASQPADNQAVPESNPGSSAEMEKTAQTFVLEDWMVVPTDRYTVSEEDSALLEELFDISGLDQAGGPAETPYGYRFIREKNTFLLESNLRFMEACIDGKAYYWKDFTEEEAQSLKALIESYTSQDETPDLRTDCIRIYSVDDYINTDDPAPMFEITDPDRVWDIISSVDFDKWEEVPLEKEYSAEPDLCVVFNDNATIVMERTIPEGYGYLCKGIRSDKENDYYHIDDPEELCTFNDGLWETIQTYLNP